MFPLGAKRMPSGVLPLFTLLSLLPLLCVSPGFGIPAARADQVPAATVDFVIDGDTVILDGGERVRLIGINAPELETEEAPAQPFAEEATRALAQLAEKRMHIRHPFMLETEV